MFNNSVKSLVTRKNKILSIFTDTVKELENVNALSHAEIQRKNVEILKMQEKINKTITEVNEFNELISENVKTQVKIQTFLNS